MVLPRDKAYDVWSKLPDANLTVDKRRLGRSLSAILVLRTIEQRAGLKGDVQPGEAMSRAAFRWAELGFPGYRDYLGTLRSIHMLLLVWAFPTNAKTARCNASIWRTLFVIQWVLGLYTLGTRCHQKSYLRVMLRAFPPEIQACLLNGHFYGCAWKSFLDSLFKLMLSDFNNTDSASNCMVFIVECSTWYTGKSNVTRKSGAGTLF